jgi:predicted DNA-binding transcriptional regulator AlpA
MSAATYQAHELADRLGVSTWAVYESVRRGDCPVTPIKVGRRLVWPKSAIDRLLGIDQPEPAA